MPLDKAELIVARQVMRERIHSLFRHRGGGDRELLRLAQSRQPLRHGDPVVLDDRAVSHAFATNAHVRRAVEGHRRERGSTLGEVRELWAIRGRRSADD